MTLDYKTYKSEILPYYLLIGLTQEYVDDSCPCDLEPYLKAHQMKLKSENERMWIQGHYIHDAFGAILSQMFSKTSKAEYPKEPYPLYGNENSKKDPEANERLALAEMMAYAKALEREGKLK